MSNLKSETFTNLSTQVPDSLSPNQRNIMATPLSKLSLMYHPKVHESTRYYFILGLIPIVLSWTLAFFVYKMVIKYDSVSGTITDIDCPANNQNIEESCRACILTVEYTVENKTQTEMFKCVDNEPALQVGDTIGVYWDGMFNQAYINPVNMFSVYAGFIALLAVALFVFGLYMERHYLRE